MFNLTNPILGVKGKRGRKKKEEKGETESTVLEQVINTKIILYIDFQYKRCNTKIFIERRTRFPKLSD